MFSIFFSVCVNTRADFLGILCLFVVVFLLVVWDRNPPRGSLLFGIEILLAVLYGSLWLSLSLLCDSLNLDLLKYTMHCLAGAFF